MKIAYLIQSHKNVPQVARLTSTLLALDPESSIYISHDVRDGPDIERLGGPRVRVSRAAGGRGGFHPIARWLTAVAEVRNDGGADYVVLISGQDYPVRPLSEMHSALAAAGDGFLECFPALHREGNHWPVREGRGRYMYRWREIFPISIGMRNVLAPLHALNRVQPWFRLNVAYGGVKLGLRRRAMPSGLECYGGSMFPSLSWRCVEFIESIARDRPDVMQWARESLVIDEAFFQTVLMSWGEFNLQLSSRRYYSFDSSRFGHPATLTTNEFEQFMASDAFFARKFDTEVDSKVLDSIDETLGIEAADSDPEPT